MNESKGYIHGPLVIARRDVLEDPELPGAARMVYLALASYSTRTGRNVKVSLEQIAERAGFVVRTVQRALDRLTELGYIKRETGGRRKGTWAMCTYDLTYTPGQHRRRMADATSYSAPDREKTPEADAAVLTLVERFGSNGSS